MFQPYTSLFPKFLPCLGKAFCESSCTHRASRQNQVSLSYFFTESIFRPLIPEGMVSQNQLLSGPYSRSPASTDAPGLAEPSLAFSNAISLFSKSINERPQLWNVIKGDEDCREKAPALIEGRETNYRYTYRGLLHRQGKRVYGRSKHNSGEISGEERWILDNAFAQKQRFWNDVRLILKTYQCYMRKKTYNAPGKNNIMNMPEVTSSSQKNTFSEKRG
ncbi:hypothetical protein QFZ20_000773 [Flavobacterium sp. W4I14]|nr:hypothetical protein [Flavobacterium sp. W4I14]